MEDANLLLVFRPIRHEANEIHDGGRAGTIHNLRARIMCVWAWC